MGLEEKWAQVGDDPFGNALHASERNVECPRCSTDHRNAINEKS